MIKVGQVWRVCKAGEQCETPLILSQLGSQHLSKYRASNPFEDQSFFLSKVIHAQRNYQFKTEISWWVFSKSKLGCSYVDNPLFAQLLNGSPGQGLQKTVWVCCTFTIEKCNNFIVIIMMVKVKPDFGRSVWVGPCWSWQCWSVLSRRATECSFGYHDDDVDSDEEDYIDERQRLWWRRW